MAKQQVFVNKSALQKFIQLGNHLQPEAQLVGTALVDTNEWEVFGSSANRGSLSESSMDRRSSSDELIGDTGISRGSISSSGFEGIQSSNDDSLVDGSGLGFAVRSLLTVRTRVRASLHADSTPEPTVPPERFKTKPKGWTGELWDYYQNMYEKVRPLRGGAGNAAASGAAVFLGADSCILKILYIFYIHEGEDDYPYIPRHCGDFFEFALAGSWRAGPAGLAWLLLTAMLMALSARGS